MNKNAIKKFATEARRELISRVSQRALKYGISEKEVGNPNDDSVGGHLLSATEKKQRAALIAQIQEKGYEQVMEEVAYTWFNRFSALRFMEVNRYLPSRVRVFTDENNAFKPQILTEAIHMELDGLDMEKVYAYKEANDEDELYKYLLITQCNALNSVLPGMFQKIADYTELLFPDNLLREGSVVQQMIELIPEEDWKDAVQIIGWLYQYYNAELKAYVDKKVKTGKKVTKEELPAKTQIFTPDWVVRYMVENSLGRLWVEGHPNDELKSQWKYYLEEAEQEPDVQAQLAEIRKEYAALTPDQLKVIDPCSGSGHILAYMFDVLVQIYEAYGVDTRTAVTSIVENNIYGLDIDDRAAQLAYFSVMMKACQYDKRFLRRKVQPHVYAIVESNHVDPNVVDYFCNGDAKLKAIMDTIIEELHDAKEYGSIITVSQQAWDAIYSRFDEIQNESVMSLYSRVALDLKKMVRVAEVMANKYDVFVTNPPYLGNGDMNVKLSSYIQDNYANSKSDTFSTFILRGRKYIKNNRFQAMVTMQSWMNLGAFENLRKIVYNSVDIVDMWHLDDSLLGIAYQTVAFVLRSSRLKDYIGKYDMATKEKFSQYENCMFNAVKGEFLAGQDAFSELTGAPIAYSLGKKCIEAYVKSKSMADVLTTREGMTTGSNETFLRLWFEVSTFEREKIWFPYSKGGEYRKWYGNHEYLVDWQSDGLRIRNFKDTKTGRIRSHNYNGEYAFKEGITWSAFSSRGATFRYSDDSFLFDSKGSKGFCDSKILLYILAFLNSSVGERYLSYFAGAKDKKPGHITALPYRCSDKLLESTKNLAEECVALSKQDWDSFETSWDFQRHPLFRKVPIIAEAFDQWQSECDDRFNQLKANEEELNRIFIDIYGLQDELTSEVEDKDVTVRKADLGRDIRSFISYAVGCMFGRYSLDVDGLAYAGGEWDASKYASFAADKDNIIPICDDEYFEDDIVGLFVKFVKTVYGADTLDENLKFIADALGGKGQPKDVIRNYFMNDFYKDHCKMYQKRPIYWLFDSGKKNGFKALIYMHRYQPDTIARIRTDYVHEQQARYRTAIADLEQRIADASIRERVKLDKQLKTLNDQATEIHTYEEKIHHLADQMISIDLDDGVKKNYAIFQDVLAKIK